MDAPRTIAHLSDIHCGDRNFMPDLMARAIAEINELEPEIVVCSGDLTTFGFKEEYAQAKRYLDRIDCDSFVVIPATTTRETSATPTSRISSATGTRCSTRTASQSSP